MGMGMPKTWGCPYHCDSGIVSAPAARLIFAAELRSKKGGGDDAYFSRASPPNLSRLVHNTASYAGY